MRKIMRERQAEVPHMSITGQDTLKTRRTLSVGGKEYDYFSLEAAEAAGIGAVGRLPFSLKVLLENLLRRENGRTVTVDDVKAVAKWLDTRKSDHEIAYGPARVLMQDFTGVPAVVDLASMRDAMNILGGDPAKINPLSPVDLVIDHSLMIDNAGTPTAFAENVALEFERNQERYEFLKWGQGAFDNFRVVPPGTGICHQVNLEYLAQVVWTTEVDGKTVAYPDTCVGTDSHTTMVNGLSVLGWGVGGIEAEAVMLGQPVSMLIPEVVGFKLTGALAEGMTATDLVLTVTEMLRKKGVVGKFVEFYGDGLDHLSLADQATIANMAPEYGATCGFFPVTQATLDYLIFTGRDADRVALVEAYAKAQGMWRDSSTPDPVYTDTLELDIGTVVPSLAGPKRPQDRLKLTDAASSFKDNFKEISGGRDTQKTIHVSHCDFDLSDGAIVIAAITSCTNTSNPAVMVAAGLVAKAANERGLTKKPWVKTSLAPGSQVVTDYLNAGGLTEHLDAIGYNLAGYGCGSCIGNSGPLPGDIHEVIEEQNLCVAAVLSGNRNFEGRVHPLTRANYLASPPLVVAYALAGNINIDLLTDPIGQDRDGKDVYLKDIWPSNAEVKKVMDACVTPEMFRARYANVLEGDANWKAIKTTKSLTYNWNPGSTYVQHPPFFEDISIDDEGKAEDIIGARPIALLGQSVTTDHISPAGNIKADSPAGTYLMEHQVRPMDFNSYGSRRGNHEVMMRGTFANIRIKNEMAPGTEGGFTTLQPTGETTTIYEAAMGYKAQGIPLVVIGGAEYGTGSSRDWAAKGTRLLGIQAVIVESFERIHRSNLVGMGVLPLQFPSGVTRQTLKLDGSETYDVVGLNAGITPRMTLALKIHRKDGTTEEVPVLCRIDTVDEVDYFLAGGILQYVLKRLAA
ncbi:MAG: aconitate hydratase AcnA [Alphaproteobacteria bacterium]|tara:strand:+ start:11533 stop:14262 length:2730 start_codon:yes stop_codon:yes gene_type:complete